MSESVDIRRREFLLASAAVGGGLVLGFYLPPRGGVIAAAAAEPASVTPSAWLRIAADGTVTIIVAKSEMGQGVYTSMPMLIAEELEADWSRVRIEPAPVADVYNHTVFGVMVTGGSTSVSSSWEQLRTVGAAAKQMLIAAAAKKWEVPVSECRAREGLVSHPGSGRSLGFGALAEGAAGEPVPPVVALKDPGDFRLIGRSLPRLDSPAKVAGTAVFGIDVQRPGMLVAVVSRPPVFGARLKSFKSEAARKVSGVRSVAQIPSGVAVIAEGYWQALKGRKALEIDWEEGEGAALSSEGLREAYRALAETPGTVTRSEGDAGAALAAAPRTLVAEYDLPYLAHAAMEPLNCVVELKDDSCEIWTGTQFQTVDRNAAAKAAGLKPEQVQIHTTYLGGGFGRRANPASDFVVEAVHVARAARAPVKVIWSREDDTRGGWYRPLWYSRLQGGLDEGGTPVAWSHRIVGQSILSGTPFEQAVAAQGFDGTSVEGAMELPYAIPNIRVDLHSPTQVVPVQWWRSVGHSHTGFVVESFLDEMAHAAGHDPYRLRRRLLADHPRHRRVLDLAAEKGGWGEKLPPGKGRGLALHHSFGSYVAQVAEVAVDEKGRIRVERVVCAVDCGRVVHPDTVRAQMESGIVFGLSATLFGELTLEKGRVLESNFHDYPVLRLEETPVIEVHLVESSEKPTGVGEPGVPPVAAAVANAVFAAVGARVRRLPLLPERVLAARHRS
ncbi:aerobic-type carbon monoxide dehydrogenase, large subunit, CoxS/CutS family [Desulfuromonas soudanensis]|uniref:Aerobic-type carbon monoxide dehydrogenase, large subunit, CoxS/CutS family n=1 Tax=Desulfuromonas soudanensis TaxID=1603606 RepID=A0A0M4CUA0_9BACT|nr:xanthine dehydrogenase family protein molybdopterin-binding subunit [Desulfuromonas soudanensis]ALC15028.1 aerobic-type carbon monoxide dehydrogenase, large subunit, CoxS/CutS family [Desulfuromonas soudanensis]